MAVQRNEDGITTMSICDFLLNDNSLELYDDFMLPFREKVVPLQTKIQEK